MKKYLKYSINITPCHNELNQLNHNIINNCDNNKGKKKEKKVKINLDSQYKSEINSANKMPKKSILKNKRTHDKNNNLLNLETNDKKEQMNTSFRSLFSVMEHPKSSVNVINNISSKSLLNESISDLKPIQSFHNKKKLTKTKNKFLKLINPGNIIKKTKISGGKDFNKELEEDSLNSIEINLQNKILDMGKSPDFFEFENNPLEVSINNRINIEKKKSKITHKLHKTDKHKNIF